MRAKRWTAALVVSGDGWPRVRRGARGANDELTAGWTICGRTWKPHEAAGGAHGRDRELQARLGLPGLGPFPSGARSSAGSARKRRGGRRAEATPRERRTSPRRPPPSTRRAWTSWARAQYPRRRAAFASYIAKYPQSDLADNAQYWIGECFYSQKDFKAPRRRFKAVADHFPFGNKVPDALYKEALCERQLGQEDAAKATLGKLLEQFPELRGRHQGPRQDLTPGPRPDTRTMRMPRHECAASGLGANP